MGQLGRTAVSTPQHLRQLIDVSQEKAFLLLFPMTTLLACSKDMRD